MHVAIQVLSYREPGLSDTLDAWSQQRIPHYVDEVSWHAAVTPRSEIRAEMAEQAEDHPVFDLLETPPGKLSSRNAAHAHALDDGADVIVAVDADAPPLREGVLSALLDPFDLRSNVVGVNSNPVSVRNPDGKFSGAGAVVDAAATIEDLAFPHMHGQASAINRAGWEAAGPFNTNLDETDARRVRGEEELSFYWRLRRVGRVVRAPEAAVYNDPRRHFCTFAPGLAPEGYCEERGVTTFQES